MADLEAIARAAAVECERQQVGEDALVRLLDAHRFATIWSSCSPALGHVLALGQIVEPDLGHIRKTPVTFRDGGSAVAASQIRPVLDEMWRLLDEDSAREISPDEFTKAFLDVHPFEDGNGRVAWLLYNWLRGSLLDPAPLPDFY